MKKSIMWTHTANGETECRIECGCHDPSHDACLVFKDDGEGLIRMEWSARVQWHTNWRDNWFVTMWLRAKTAWTMFTTGYFEGSEDFIFNEDNLAAFSLAIQSATQRHKSWQAKRTNAPKVKKSLKELVKP